MIRQQDPLAVGEDLVRVLDDAVGRESAILYDRFIEPRLRVIRTPSALASSASMSIALSSPARKQVVVVRRRGEPRA